MKFGNNLKNLRKSKNMSQEDLAEKMNVSRQSVSKWETGDAYPEMNNILELCKIFKCNINDLVNDSIIDIESLDEDIKTHAVKFKLDKQRQVKTLSNLIAILAKIGRIVITVCIPIVILVGIILPFLISRVNVSNNEITFDNSSDKLSIEEKDDEVVVKFNNSVIASETDTENILKIKEVFSTTSKPLIIGYSISGCIFLLVYLILLLHVLKHLENLAENIREFKTPFTLENVNHIRKMAYLLIASVILPNIVGGIFQLLISVDLNIGFEMFSLIEILFIFTLAYIFEYGYEIQRDSKGIMYGEEDE